MSNIHDVAKMAGVSITTVSHVLNGTRYVSPDTAARVQAAIEALHYSPNSTARAMVRGETRTLALVVPDNTNPFFAELAHSIENFAFNAGYSTFLCNSGHSLTKEETYLKMLVSRRVDGLIYMTEDSHTDQLKPFQAQNIPVVVFDRDYDEFDAVLLENFKGGYDVTRYLLELGHRRIACISSHDRLRSSQRMIGYQQALKEAGIEFDPGLVYYGDWSYQSGLEAARKFLTLDPPPTAIFSSNDVMAMGAVAQLREQRLRVPEDVSIVGFDNISMTAYSSPPLTTLSMPIQECGQMMCQLLLNRINEVLPPEPQRIHVNGSLVVRGSAAPHR